MKQNSALECFLPCAAGGCLSRNHMGQQGAEGLGCLCCIGVASHSLGDSQDQPGLDLVSAHTATAGLQKRGLEPWFSNSDQASLSSMKIILAYCS